MSKVDVLLGVARNELGTKESPAHSNRVKYNTWYYGRPVSGNSYPWCMVFVQWCFELSGATLPHLTASCGALLRWYRARQPECVVREPRPGDIVIYDFPGGAATDHTGIVESVHPTTITAIEGNTGTTSDANGGAVMRRTRDKSLVAAYIRPKELEEEQMSDQEIYEAVQRHAATLSVPAGVQAEYEEAVALGLTDGSDPCRLVPAWRAAVMALRAGKTASALH